MHKSPLRLLVQCLVLCCLVVVVHAAPLFKAGDRIVFYGDSITEQQLYTRYVQQYIQCRYPQMKITFFNAGWSGDTAGGAVNRLERDVLPLKPTIVTLFFGMNDGGYGPVNDGVVNAYRANMDALITALKAKGVRVVVFTPGCVDYDRNKGLGDSKYNATLEALGKAALELAQKHQCVSGDVLHPMVEVQTTMKAADAAFTMIPDSVHPNEAGHLVVAAQMLKTLGADPMPALGEVDVTATAAKGLRAQLAANGVVTLQSTAPSLLPFWFDPASGGVVRECGLLALAGQRLTVRGLQEGAYEVSINGTSAGRFTREELAAGAFIPGYYATNGKLLHDLIMRRERNYYSAWREIRLPFSVMPEGAAMVAGMMDADAALQQAIFRIAGEKTPLTITLTPTPTGQNLALNKTYVSSDPNKYGWNPPSLTDGSWEMNSAHCYASGDSATFPKMVTIDLEAPSTINGVIVGMPNFGSTKTVAVAVSLDGTQFTEIGSHAFPLRTETRHTYTCTPVQARYVRLTYPDHYEESVIYPVNFVFTNEMEVYGER